MQDITNHVDIQTFNAKKIKRENNMKVKIDIFSPSRFAAKTEYSEEFVAIVKSFDSYTTCVPIEHLADPATLLATHRNGEPLTRAHGGPVRLIVPKLYLWKSAKWIRQIWLTDAGNVGYWEARGYHRRGDPWAEERYGR